MNFKAAIAPGLVLLALNTWGQTPVMHLPFNGNANDVSGNNNHGILGGENNNPVLTTDRFGTPNSAYEFGGFFNKNWIQVPNSPSLTFTSQMSVSLWYQQCQFDGMDGWGSYVPNGNHVICSKAGDGYAANRGIWNTSNTDANGVLSIGYHNKNTPGNTPTNFSGNTGIPCFDPCEWVHFVATVNNTVLRLYVNGVLMNEVIGNPADFSQANINDFWIGRMFGSNVIWYPFNGKIDDVMLFNYALSQAEVDNLFGGYEDPLLDNFDLLSVDINGTSCNGQNNTLVTVNPDPAEGPFEYSINGGTTWQPGNTFSALTPGSHTIRVRNECAFVDTVVTVLNCPPIPPVLTVPDNSTYCGSNHCQPVSPNLTITDPDNVGVDGAMVYFNSGYVTGQDVLQLTPQFGITGNFNPATGVLSLNGQATAAQYEQVLRSICYINTSVTPSSGQREVYFVLGGLLYNPDNGHYYQLVNHGSAICWTDASTAAAASMYLGMQGYLVTVTSQQENDFLAQLIQTDTWTGASDAAQEGVWRWVTGCEGLEANGQGRHFFTDDPGCNHPGGGNPVGGNFNAWNVNQPDNYQCLEHHMQFVPGTGGLWNDLPNCSGVTRYIVEYGCMPNDPQLQIAASATVEVLDSQTYQQQVMICGVEVYTLPGGAIVSQGGVYTDIFQTVNGCDSIISTTLTLLPTLSLTSDSTASTCAASCDGTASVIASGGSGTYEYSWNTVPVQTTATATGLCAGNYTCTVSDVGNCVPSGIELVANGDFSLGNTGFTTGYTYCNTANCLWPLADNGYSVGSSAAFFHNSFQGQDHTTGTGNMMIVNGGDPALDIWCQTIGVTPNTTYDFSAWIGSVGAYWNVAELNFTVNGNSIGTITAPTTGPIWIPFNASWSSGSNTTATICIRNLNGTASGNDFMLDDLSFQSCIYPCEVETSVIVSSSAPVVPDTVNAFICNGESLTLPSGATVSLTGIYTDTLLSVNGCDSIIITELTVNPTPITDLSVSVCSGQSHFAQGAQQNMAGMYFDTLSTHLGCDSVIITQLLIEPLITHSVDVSICQGQTYLAQGDQQGIAGTYSDTLVTPFGCDSLLITQLFIEPIITFTMDTSVCPGDSVFTGGNWKLQPGTYTDSLQTPEGCDSLLTTVLSNHPSPVAAIAAGNACLDEPLTVSDASTVSSGSITAWQWDLGNGNSSSQQQPPPQAYPDAGNYTLTLTVWTVHGCPDSAETDVVIHPLPVADFTADSVCHGLFSTFTDLSTGTAGYPVTQWGWVFSDGQTSTQQHPQVLFAQPGPYGALLTVTNSAGCKADTSMGNVMAFPIPQAVLNVPDDHCYRDTAFFSESSTIDAQWGDSLISWDWEFEGVTLDNLLEFSHVFASHGFHTVNLSVESSNGCLHDTSAVVEVYARPSSAFSLSETEGCEPLTVEYVDQSTIAAPYGISEWHWTLSNAELSEEQFPTFTHAYEGPDGIQPDSVLVALWTVSSNGCASLDTAMAMIAVYPLPSAAFSADPAVSDMVNPIIRLTDASTLNVTDWNWIFGDGQASFEQHPSHLYGDTGVYYIALYVTTTYGCTDTTGKQILINPYFSFYVPNAFTPNGNRRNDAFRGVGEGYSDHFLTMYNRWGEQIFHGDGDIGWDGTYKGTPVEVGVYPYRIELKEWTGEQRVFTGHVNLIR